jgi:hypothetical protein
LAIQIASFGLYFFIFNGWIGHTDQDYGPALIITKIDALSNLAPSNRKNDGPFLRLTLPGESLELFLKTHRASVFMKHLFIQIKLLHETSLLEVSLDRIHQPVRGKEYHDTSRRYFTDLD